jgi:hypothetical protein
MRWTAPCVASLVVAAGLCGATAIARPISPVAPARTSTANPSVLLGYVAVGSATASSSAGQPESFSFRGRRSGSVSSIHVFIDSRNRAKSLVAGLYSDASGRPGALLTVGALNHPRTGAWNSLRVRPTSIRSGHAYWLAVLGRGGRLYFRTATSGRCSAEKAHQTRMHSLRSSWTGRPAHSRCRISAYATRGKATNGTVNGVLSPVAGGGSNGGATGNAGGPPPTLSCDLNATTANFTTQIANAAPGQVVCLASGDYSAFRGTSKPAPGITITSAPGATVTFNSGMNLNLSSVQNFALDGTGGGGTMTVGGLLDMETSGDALQNKALNLTFQNLAFTATGYVIFQGPENSNVTFNRDTFVAGNTTCNGMSATGVTYEFLLPYETATATTPSGLTIENSVFVAPADLWNPRRAIQTATPMTVAGNVFVGYLDHLGASCNHIDTLQVYSRSNGTSGGITFSGNLCYDDYGCFMAFDGTSFNTITNNVCFELETACVSLYSDTGSVVSDNTEPAGGVDPSYCANLPNLQRCTSTRLLLNSNKSGDRAPSGETYANNVDQPGPSVEAGSLTTNTNNMWSGASAPNINGRPTFQGGASPTTWAGFALTAGSAGHAGATDGLGVGIRSSAGGPPTGGGSAPVNTGGPALRGSAVQGQTLSTTTGAWTITGWVPTVTTYMWWDCPTSAFSPGSCSPIQPQTAPTSANSPTYTLQSSDIGDYVFAEVTVTNANGQVNAVSTPAGPVAP